jgi:hypothetical protein
MTRRGGDNAPQWDEAGIVGMECTAGGGANAAGIPPLPVPLSHLQKKKKATQGELSSPRL